MQLSERLLVPGAQEQSTEVIDNLLRKQRLMEAGDPAHEAIVPAFVLGAGGKRGAFQAGALVALHEAGLHRLPKYIVGGSVGSINGAYTITDQAPLGASAYTEDLSTREFIDPRRGSRALNLEYLEEVIATKKPLDTQALQAAPTELHIGLTDVATGTATYVAAHQIAEADIIPTMLASAAVPGAAAPREVHGGLYSDAITACKNPVEYALSLGATDVLYIVNQPLRDQPTITRRERFLAFAATRSRHYSDSFRAAHRDRHTMSDETETKVYDANVAVLAPETMPLSRLSIDRRMSLHIGRMGYTMMQGVLGAEIH